MPCTRETAPPSPVRAPAPPRVLALVAAEQEGIRRPFVAWGQEDLPRLRRAVIRARELRLLEP